MPKHRSSPPGILPLDGKASEEGVPGGELTVTNMLLLHPPPAASIAAFLLSRQHSPGTRRVTSGSAHQAILMEGLFRSVKSQEALEAKVMVEGTLSMPAQTRKTQKDFESGREAS